MTKQSKKIDTSTLSLLDDQPSAEDHFGGHINIAKGIKQIIDTDKKGKSIALLGDWGSGKSTVVEILKKQCRDDKEAYKNTCHPFFIEIDAWATEIDPTKKSFLQFTLKAAKHRLNSEYENLEREINGQPRLEKTPWIVKGLYFGLIISIFLAVPLGLKYFPDKWVNISLKEHYFWLYVSPFFFALFLSLKKAGHNLILNAFGNSGIPAPNDTDTTQLEFNKLLNNILSESSFNPNQKIIFVIDNIDRLDQHRAENLWASLSGLISEINEVITKARGTYFVLVPIHQKSIIKAQEIVLKAPNNTKPNGYYAPYETITPNNDLIEKLFDIKINVPSFYSHNWHDYFKEQITIAVPSISKSEITNVISMLNDQNITPRNIGKYINELVVLAIKDQENLPIDVIAFYHNHVSTSEHMGTHQSFVNLLNQLPYNLQKPHYSALTFASLYYSVDLNEAEKITSKSNISNWLRLGKAEGLKEAIKVPNFYEAFHSACNITLKAAQNPSNKSLDNILRSLSVVYTVHSYAEEKHKEKIMDHANNLISCILAGNSDFEYHFPDPELLSFVINNLNEYAYAEANKIFTIISDAIIYNSSFIPSLERLKTHDHNDESFKYLACLTHLRNNGARMAPINPSRYSKPTPKISIKTLLQLPNLPYALKHTLKDLHLDNILNDGNT